MNDRPCRALANQSGCVVISVDYRLAPEHPFPAAADDAYAATSFVAENAASFGVDPARLAVGGDSAGGNLAAVVALRARDSGGPALAFQLLVYPLVDFTDESPSMREYADGLFLTPPGWTGSRVTTCQRPSIVASRGCRRCTRTSKGCRRPSSDGGVRSAAGSGRDIREAAAGRRCPSRAEAVRRHVPSVLQPARRDRRREDGDCRRGGGAQDGSVTAQPRLRGAMGVGPGLQTRAAVPLTRPWTEWRPRCRDRTERACSRSRQASGRWGSSRC